MTMLIYGQPELTCEMLSYLHKVLLSSAELVRKPISAVVDITEVSQNLGDER